ncbi:unnamed protein product [Hapterophycus canaliculatus]
MQLSKATLRNSYVAAGAKTAAHTTRSEVLGPVECRLHGGSVEAGCQVVRQKTESKKDGVYGRHSCVSAQLRGRRQTLVS